MRIRRRDVFHAPKRTELPIVYHGGFAEHDWTPADSWVFVKVTRSSQHWCDLLCILLLRGVMGKLTAVINLTDWRFSLFRKFGNGDVSTIACVSNVKVLQQTGGGCNTSKAWCRSRRCGKSVAKHGRREDARMEIAWMTGKGWKNSALGILNLSFQCKRSTVLCYPVAPSCH